ncbi:MAG: DUF4190 domain-containing protein [Flavobacteriaceae bacterium]|jgi:hypothetical protein|nr:DUF4190 domain-containing protein [Flavobacteriaceae bacterium]
MNQQNLPNATAVLVLGIISIVMCWCYGIIGIITGGIGLYLASKDNASYQLNPTEYSNYSNLKTGKILCIIGLILSVLFLIYMVWIFSVVGMDALSDPELMRERIRELSGQ